MKEFIEKMIDVLDYEGELSMDTVLNELEEWDSLSFVNFMAMANITYGKKIVSANVREAKTILDLYNLVK